MSTHPPAAALAVRRARERRTRALRLRIVAVGVAIFLVAWVGIFVQLATGNDPALAKALVPVATQSADPGSTSDDAASQSPWPSDTSAPATDATSGDGGVAAAPAPAAVTTRQS
jgi:hypothetical protein